jgi:hypothetical protein
MFAHGVTYNFEVFKEPVELQSMQRQIKGLHIIKALLCSLQKHNFKLPQAVDVVTDGVPCAICSKNGTVYLL